jgi:hypothetical protein
MTCANSDTPEQVLAEHAPDCPGSTNFSLVASILYFKISVKFRGCLAWAEVSVEGLYG